MFADANDWNFNHRRQAIPFNSTRNTPNSTLISSFPDHFLHLIQRPADAGGLADLGEAKVLVESAGVGIVLRYVEADAFAPVQLREPERVAQSCAAHPLPRYSGRR